jgi:hypothetical protein
MVMVGELVAGQDPEGKVLDAAPLDLPRRRIPTQQPYSSTPNSSLGS